MEKSQFDSEGKQFIAKEVSHRREAGVVADYNTPLESATDKFKKRAIELRKATHKIDKNLELLREQWKKVKEAGAPDALDSALNEYIAEGQRIERWLKLADDGGGEENQEAPKILAARDAIRNISPTERGRWGKLLNEINILGTIQGSRAEAYSAEELRDIINEIRLDPKKLNKLTNGGILGINNKVRAFLQVDGAKIE